MLIDVSNYEYLSHFGDGGLCIRISCFKDEALDGWQHKESEKIVFAENVCAHKQHKD